MKQEVTVSGKVDGIPENINHNHDVILEVRLSDSTTNNIKDIIVTGFFMAGVVWSAKSLVSTANRLLIDQQYAKLYPPRNF